MIQPWKTIGSRPLGNFHIFTVRSDRKVSPRTRQEHEFYVIECANWVNVIALTSERCLVMVEQYRHGSNTVELEIPGGIIDPGDAGPEAAGERELREETGYVGEKATRIGQIYPNPAIMANVCYTVVVENCRCLHPVDLDSTEDLVTRLVPLDGLPALVAAGRIQHSLVAVALGYFEIWQRRPGAKGAGLKPKAGS
jgi:ADP-ribose pyrophosphatase